MKIIIFGGDGFCGWPTTLHLSNLGHEILIIDNLSRRNIDKELEAYSLTPIISIHERIKEFNHQTGKNISFLNINVAEDYSGLLNCIIDFNPEAVVHFAEQRAAPYSMKSSFHKSYTVNNNINATNNILTAIVDSKKDIHLVHLGTMGVYGYDTIDAEIPEGYLNVKIKDKKGEYVDRDILFPTNPGSIYHATKSMDQILFSFYNKNDNMRITDLHQGIVWGLHTKETQLSEGLINRFDYDGDYGTVLNRFLIQAAVNYPLTVHGSGGQTRAFINIQDTVRCIELAIMNPPSNNSKVQIFNQVTETHKVSDLAKLVSDLTGAEISYLENPRKEADSNELSVSNKNLLKLGLQPIKLSDSLLMDINFIAKKYKSSIDTQKIPCVSRW